MISLRWHRKDRLLRQRARGRDKTGWFPFGFVPRAGDNEFRTAARFVRARKSR